MPIRPPAAVNARNLLDKRLAEIVVGDAMLALRERGAVQWFIRGMRVSRNLVLLRATN
jgi:hypothetical protein